MTEQKGALQTAFNKDPRDIVLKPVVSEKSYSLIDEGKYTFLVDPRAYEDRDQARDREDLRCQGRVGQHDQPRRQGPSHPLRHRQAQGHQARHRGPEVGHHRHLHGNRLIRGIKEQSWLFASTSPRHRVVAVRRWPTSLRSPDRRRRSRCCARSRRPVVATIRAASRPVTSVVATSASTASSTSVAMTRTASTPRSLTSSTTPTAPRASRCCTTSTVRSATSSPRTS